MFIQQNVKRIKTLIASAACFLFFHASANAAELNIIYQEDFNDDYNPTASGWHSQTTNGKLEVDSANGETALKVYAGSAGTTITSTLSLGVSTPADTTYYVEYRYLTNSTNRKWDILHLNPSDWPNRLTAQLRQGNGEFALFDDDKSTFNGVYGEGLISPNVWHNIKLAVEPLTNTFRLWVDGKYVGEKQSNYDFSPLEQISLRTFNENTFFIDDLTVYTRQEERLIDQQGDVSYYLNDNFDGKPLTDWSVNTTDGSVSIVANPEGAGDVIAFYAGSGSNKTIADYILAKKVPNDEPYIVRFDYYTSTINSPWDFIRLNAYDYPNRLTAQLRHGGGEFALSDDGGQFSRSPVGIISANQWHSIELSVDPLMDKFQLAINGEYFPVMQSNNAIKGLEEFSVWALKSNTFYFDNLQILTYGEEPAIPPLVPQGTAAYYYQADFENDYDAHIEWEVLEQDGHFSIVDNPKGDDSVLMIDGGNDKTIINLTLNESTPSDEAYVVEYDYYPTTTNSKWDFTRLNGYDYDNRLTAQLRGNKGQYSLFDNGQHYSATSEYSIAANQWHHIKMTVKPQSNQYQLTINGKNMPVATSFSLLEGLSELTFNAILGNHYYIDNLKIYTYGVAPTPVITKEPAEVPHERPRVLVSADSLSALETRFYSDEMSFWRELILDEEAARNDADFSHNGKIYSAEYRAIEAAALLYLVNGDLEKGEKARRMLLEGLNTAATPATAHDDANRIIHRFVLTAALTYDWVYDLFTEQERQQIIANVTRLVSATEYGYPMTFDSFVLGHSGEEKLPAMLAFGIAVYDEDPSFYHHAAGYLYEKFVPNRDFFYPAGKHTKGVGYAGRYDSEMLSTILITRMGGERPYTDEQALLQYHAIYARRPDGILMTSGDDFLHSFTERSNVDGVATANWGILGLTMAATEYQDPYLQDDVNRFEHFVNGHDTLKGAAFFMLLKDETLAAKPVAELPLTRVFNYPNSGLIARTGWDIQGGQESNVMIAELNMGEYHTGGHDHLDTGHFSLYYKAPLAIDSGAYSISEVGDCKFGNCQHFLNYYQKSIAHNTLLIQNNEDAQWGIPNEGGQVPKLDPNKVKLRTAKDIQHNNMAQILGVSVEDNSNAPDYSYIHGDMARAYPTSSEVKRAMVFLNLKDDINPGALIVFDKITANDESYKKRWLLHSHEEPQIIDNKVIIEGFSGLLGDNYFGKLVNNTLLPVFDNLVINKVGGSDREFWTESTATANRLKYQTDIKKFEAGQWRVELSPKVANTQDTFLNVLQAFDSSGVQELPVSMLENQRLIGAQIKDRQVYFTKSGVRLREDITFSVSNTTERTKVLFTQLNTGTWTVLGNRFAQTFNVTEQAGTLYLSLSNGEYQLVQGDQSQRDSDGDGISDANDDFYLDANRTLVGDFDGDNDVDRKDISFFVRSIRNPESIDPRYDFNQDGVIHQNDVSALRTLCSRARCAE